MKALRRRRPEVDEWLGERVFVSCAVDDELAHTIDKLGDDFLMTATDFPHGDAFREDHLAESLAERGDLSPSTIDKILDANPQRLYHLFRAVSERFSRPSRAAACWRAAACGTVGHGVIGPRQAVRWRP